MDTIPKPETPENNKELQSIKTDFHFRKEAAKAFEAILSEEPSNFIALYGQALALYCDSKHKESVAFFDRALELAPMNDSVKQFKLSAERIARFVDEEEARRTKENPWRNQKTSMSPGAICKVCDKTFTKTYSLNRHMALHTGERNHKCEHCQRAFVQKSDMERHKVTHSTEMNFECTECLRRFKTKKNLNCHMITHTTSRPFKCSSCPKDFKTSRLLRFHEGLHSGSKKFRCAVCDKGFPAKAYMNSHLKVHSNERKFKCPVEACAIAFKRRYDCNVHVRNKHSVEKTIEKKVEKKVKFEEILY